MFGPTPSSRGTHYQYYLPGYTCTMGPQYINCIGEGGRDRGGRKEYRGRGTDDASHWFGQQDDPVQGGTAQGRSRGMTTMNPSRL